MRRKSKQIRVSKPVSASLTPVDGHVNVGTTEDVFEMIAPGYQSSGLAVLVRAAVPLPVPTTPQRVLDAYIEAAPRYGNKRPVTPEDVAALRVEALAAILEATNTTHKGRGRHICTNKGCFWHDDKADKWTWTGVVIDLSMVPEPVPLLLAVNPEAEEVPVDPDA